jgi:iron complex transport system ATP-binding protein
MISIDKGGVRFGQRWIFRGLDLRLEKGISLAVLGPNGRGKTTLVRAILGFQALTEGERHAPSVIGYVPQSIGRDVAYRVRQVVAMGRVAQRGMFALPSAIDRRAADAALERVGMRHVADLSFDRLSGGERQLVVLARALATGAETLVLDEPASALDLRNQDLFLSVLGQLRADRSHAIVFTTHLPQHASAAADDVLMMTGAETRLHGPIGETMTEENLSALYGIGVRLVDVEAPGGGRLQGVVPVFGRAAAS